MAHVNDQADVRASKIISGIAPIVSYFTGIALVSDAAKFSFRDPGCTRPDREYISLSYFFSSKKIVHQLQVLSADIIISGNLINH